MATTRMTTLIRLAAVSVALGGAACSPTPTSAPSPITTTITTTAGQRSVTYYSPQVCSPVGTTVRLTVTGNEHHVAATVTNPAQPVVIAPGESSAEMTTNQRCWRMAVEYSALLTGGDLGGDDVDLVITWPV